jgi:hypothetical protein
MASSRTVSTGVGVDVTSFNRFAKALKSAEPILAKELRVQFAAAGAEVASEARTIVSEYSEEIPPTIKVRMSSLTVKVVAGNNNLPLAGLFELGNKGNRRAGATSFRHPVFGDTTNWVAQPTHPFLTPAIESKADKIMVGVIEALDKAITEVVSGDEV